MWISPKLTSRRCLVAPPRRGGPQRGRCNWDASPTAIGSEPSMRIRCTSAVHVPRTSHPPRRSTDKQTGAPRRRQKNEFEGWARLRPFNGHFFSPRTHSSPKVSRLEPDEKKGAGVSRGVAPHTQSRKVHDRAHSWIEPCHREALIALEKVLPVNGTRHSTSISLTKLIRSYGSLSRAQARILREDGKSAR